MGSEGYLINQFIVSKTNQRTDEWGGSFENRIKFPLEIVQRIREKAGNDFIIIYRLSMLDLVEDGSSWQEVVQLAKAIEQAGANIINTGIGWHEARIPTIATMVPRAGFAWVTKRLMGEVNIPLITTNRINTPEIAEKILADGCADMVSMARPFLADPDFMLKAKENRADEINTCIACNQACLDNIFNNKRASCLVNPRACNEYDWQISKAATTKKIAVVGAGPAGLSCAVTAAQRGHEVVLYEASTEIGGQFNLAKKIPGKEEFYETLRYFKKQIALSGVTLMLNTKADIFTCIKNSYDEVVLATGVFPRDLTIDGIHHRKVVGYTDVLKYNMAIGKKVAIIGAGGIGFDVATFLSEKSETTDEFLKTWGVDKQYQHRGGLMQAEKIAPDRDIYLLQRTKGKVGDRLGKTTGWIHRATLKKHRVQLWDGVEYHKIDDAGLHISRNGERQILDVDNVIICAGQVAQQELFFQLKEKGFSAHLIGGAYEALELDARRAIEQGTKLAMRF